MIKWQMERKEIQQNMQLLNGTTWGEFYEKEKPEDMETYVNSVIWRGRNMGGIDEEIVAGEYMSSIAPQKKL